jgi:hypothetical protein
MNQDGTTSPIIWPLLAKLNPILAAQQRPRWTGGRPVSKLPSLPWDDMDRPPSINYGRTDLPPTAMSTMPSNFGLCAIRLISVRPSEISKPPYAQAIRQPAVVHAIKPLPPKYYSITGITKDSSGNVLANCVVELHRTIIPTNTDVITIVDRTTSDANGVFEFRSAATVSNYYLVAYKAGSPDVAGTTVNTLVGS